MLFLFLSLLPGAEDGVTLNHRATENGSEDYVSDSHGARTRARVYVGMRLAKRDARGRLSSCPFSRIIRHKVCTKEEESDERDRATSAVLIPRAPRPLLRRSLIYSPSEFFTVPTFTGPLRTSLPQTNTYILPVASDTMYYRVLCPRWLSFYYLSLCLFLACTFRASISGPVEVSSDTIGFQHTQDN